MIFCCEDWLFGTKLWVDNNFITMINWGLWEIINYYVEYRVDLASAILPTGGLKLMSS